MSNVYTEEDARKWHKEYENIGISAKTISQKYGVKHDTMLNWFRKLGLTLRTPGFKATNAKGKYGLDPLRLAYVHQYKFAYLRRAGVKGMEMTITEDEFITLVQGNCRYCGKSYKEETRRVGNLKNVPMLSIDRLDSSKGYTLDNCVPCCKQCNTMKMDFSEEDFLAKVARVYKFLNLKDL